MISTLNIRFWSEEKPEVGETILLLGSQTRKVYKLVVTTFDLGFLDDTSEGRGHEWLPLEEIRSLIDGY